MAESNRQSTSSVYPEYVYEVATDTRSVEVCSLELHLLKPADTDRSLKLLSAGTY